MKLKNLLILLSAIFMTFAYSCAETSSEDSALSVLYTLAHNFE